jgi:hypothetical protein
MIGSDAMQWNVCMSPAWIKERRFQGSRINASGAATEISGDSSHAFNDTQSMPISVIGVHFVHDLAMLSDTNMADAMICDESIATQ